MKSVEGCKEEVYTVKAVNDAMMHRGRLMIVGCLRGLVPLSPCSRCGDGDDLMYSIGMCQALRLSGSET